MCVCVCVRAYVILQTVLCCDVCAGGEGVEGGVEGGEEGGASGGGVTGGSPEARAHRARRRSSARAKLPNKPMDWQVCTPQI